MALSRLVLLGVAILAFALVLAVGSIALAFVGRANVAIAFVVFATLTAAGGLSVAIVGAARSGGA